MRVVYCCRFIRSLIGSRTSVDLKVSGEQLQSSCRRVNFDLTVFDSKPTFHRVFDRHCLEITHIEWSDKFEIFVQKKCPVTSKKNYVLRLFTFSSHTEKVLYSQEWKKKSLHLTNVYVLYVLEDKKSKKKFRLSVCLAVWLSGCRYVDFSCGHNNFRRSYRIQPTFGGCLLCMKCRSGIDIQSNVMILILIPILIRNRIFIFTKTLRSDTFGGYL